MKEKKQKGNVITRKMEVVILHPTKEGKDAAYRLMRDWNDKSWRMANEVVRELYVSDHVVERAAMRHEDYNKPLLALRQAYHKADRQGRKAINKEKTALLKEAGEKMGLFVGKGVSQQNIGYRAVVQMYDDVPSHIYASVVDQTTKNFRNDKPLMWKGERSIRSYKKGVTPFTRNAITRIVRDGEDYHMLFMPKQKTFEGCTFAFTLGRDRSDNASILRGLISGEYKLCNSSYSFDGPKLFFHLVVSMPAKTSIVDHKRTIGVDLGMKCMIRYTDGKSVRGSIGGDGQLQSERRRLFCIKRSMQAGLVYAGGGHGRKHKMRGLDRLRDKEANFASTWNHRYAKELIDVCLKGGYGTIKMEDLTGLGSNMKGMLKRWSYYDLQTKIEQKAQKEGIVVLYVDPNGTSLTCHKCGHCHKDNRKIRDTFSCMNTNCVTFGKKMDADLNAAINVLHAEPLKETVEA